MTENTNPELTPVTQNVLEEMLGAMNGLAFEYREQPQKSEEFARQQDIDSFLADMEEIRAKFDAQIHGIDWENRYNKSAADFAYEYSQLKRKRIARLLQSSFFFLFGAAVVKLIKKSK